MDRKVENKGVIGHNFACFCFIYWSKKKLLKFKFSGVTPKSPQKEAFMTNNQSWERLVDCRAGFNGGTAGRIDGGGWT